MIHMGFSCNFSQQNQSIETWNFAEDFSVCQGPGACLWQGWDGSECHGKMASNGSAASYGYQMTYWEWSYLVGNHLFEVSKILSHARMLHLAGFYGHKMVRLVNIGPEFLVNFRHHSWLVVTGTCWLFLSFGKDHHPSWLRFFRGVGFCHQPDIDRYYMILLAIFLDIIINYNGYSHYFHHHQHP